MWRVLLVAVLLLAAQRVRPAAAGPSGGACGRFNAVPSWSGAISITFKRSATTPNYTESSSGSMSYRVNVAHPPLSIGLNGYDQTWVGSPAGSGQFRVQVTNADGSALSRPVTLDGTGALLTHPPLGKFGPEQFWINSSKCVYAVYTSAALQARHSRDGPLIDGVAVHVEAIPLPATGNVMAGSKAFVLPNAGNYSGGDQFFYPCVLVDWCNRGSGT
jgi:hypothetical protein